MAVDTQAVTGLREGLARLYPTVDRSFRIIEQAGLDTIDIRSDSNARTNWYNILQEARKFDGKIDAIVDEALKEYPTNQALQRGRLIAPRHPCLRVHHPRRGVGQPTGRPREAHRPGQLLCRSATSRSDSPRQRPSARSCVATVKRGLASSQPTISSSRTTMCCPTRRPQARQPCCSTIKRRWTGCRWRPIPAAVAR